jgi:hypothetical protein
MANVNTNEVDCNQIIEDYIKKQKARIKKLKDKCNKSK